MNQERILIAPLNWGLGHASRCVPLIDRFLNEGHYLLIAGYGDAGEYLKKRYPQLEYIHFPGMEINYANKRWMKLKMLYQFPKLIRSISKEHIQLKSIIEKHKITKVISDNRFGMYNKNVHCVFITHQVFIKTGLFEKLIHKINSSYIRRYNECWIPDVEMEPSLSGELSHGNTLPENCKYIGPLSRFSGVTLPPAEATLDVVIVISGPEPSRTMFEMQMIERFKNTGKKIALIRGTCAPSTLIFPSEFVTVVDLAMDDELLMLYAKSKHIICRSGYSTIMDLHALNLTAEYIATPGQPEQEYLAKLHSKHN